MTWFAHNEQAPDNLQEQCKDPLFLLRTLQALAFLFDQRTRADEAAILFLHKRLALPLVEARWLWCNHGLSVSDLLSGSAASPTTCDMASTDSIRVETLTESELGMCFHINVCTW